MGLNAGAPSVFDSRTVLVGPQLSLLLDDDDELAAVLGHEVAHIAQGHTTSQATWNAVISTMQVLVAVAVLRHTGSPAEAVVAGGLTGLAAHGALTVSGFSRDQERDADYYGLHYAFAAGFDPAAALSAFFKIAMVEKGCGGKASIPFLNDHPGTDERLVRLTKEVSRTIGGDFSRRGLHCWHAPAGSGECRTCCTTTSYCVSECP
jgi:predicted Zn-dependent protease